MPRMLAVVDKDMVLVDRISSPTQEQWDAAPEHTRFEHGFDNRLKAYRLVEWKPGRWRFEPIVHEKDKGRENPALHGDTFPVGAIARVVLATGQGRKANQQDLNAVAAFCQTFDGAL